MVAFENHLNVFHNQKHGIQENLARGLTVYLNSSIVDETFRRFSGHTQVNATDLRLIKYPNRDILFSLGKWSKGLKNISQTMIDNKLSELIK